MTDVFDDLGPVTFESIAFPVESCRVSGGMRKHVHSYPKVPGGKPEKLGRELYVVELECLFDVSMHRRYPNLWPDGLESLIELFEAGRSGALFIPHRGTIRSFADRWTRDMSARVRSGERASFTFLEEEDRVSAVYISTPRDVKAKRLKLSTLIAEYDSELDPAGKSLFDRIDDAANQFLAFRDQAELATLAGAAKVERLTGLCREADRTVKAFRKPTASPLLEATKELWAAAVDAYESAVASNPIHLFTVPRRMALPEIAAAIFGDSSRGQDLLDLNFFRDAYAIPAGTVVRYLEAA